MSPEPLRASMKQTFEYDKPTVPDVVLLQIEKADFKRGPVKKKDKNTGKTVEVEETLFSGYAKIVESLSYPDNVGMGMPLFYGLYMVNDKPFKIQNFLGLLTAVKGEEVTVPHAQFFDDVRRQAEVQEKLTNKIFAASIVENVFKDKDTGKVVENVQFETFHTKAEYTEMKNKAGISGVPGPAASGVVPALTPQADIPGMEAPTKKPFF